MTIAEAERFYKVDKKEYNPKENKQFLHWYSKQLKEGYTSHLDIKGMQSLIDKIINWYELKFPFRQLNEQSDYTNMKFQDIADLSATMTVDQLRYRLFHDELETLDCHYRTGWGGLSSDDEPAVCMNIKKKNANELEEIMIQAVDFNGKIKGWIGYDLELYLGEKNLENITLRSLLLMFENSNRTDFDYSELRDCIERNNIDISLRFYLLNMVALGLFYSKNTIPEYGLFRAKQFINDFNSYYNIGLSSDYLDQIMSLDYSKDNNLMLKKSYHLPDEMKEVISKVLTFRMKK